ncbi:hypothetical protein K445DRAFT_320334 [Daldinia sp. EC12]|nr:hypothetical protein K445DRAFT_320334 [Daldinia sp. EC12]
MTCINLPLQFQNALVQSREYPRNNIYKAIDAYPKSLDKSYVQLGQRELSLFEESEAQWEIPIRDLNNTCDEHGRVKKRNIHTHDKLLDWLGINVQETSTSHNAPIVTATKKDPKCRFICLYGIHSRAKLKLTKAMLVDILTFHQVMPAFLEFLFIFGQQSEATDMHFAGFHQQVILGNPPDGMVIPELERSGKEYQICYNLKCAAYIRGSKEDIRLDEWSIRPAVFYHKFDVSNGNTLWIVIKGGLEIQQRFKALTDKDARIQDKSFGTPEECFRSSLSAHLMYCHWATEDWRWYIKWLEQMVDKENIMALFGSSEVGSAHKTYTPRDIQDLQIWEERVRKVIVTLEGNVDVMISLARFYRQLPQDKGFPLRKSCSLDIGTFSGQIGNFIRDIKMQIKRAGFLEKTISDRRELVIQHLQSQAASRAEILSRSMEQEQVFMLIITVVTLIFLPATFVSTFFSTDVIKYQGSESPDGSFSATAMNRWLQVTIPLTIFTCSAAYFARQCMLAERKRNYSGLEQPPLSWKAKVYNLIYPPTLLPLHKEVSFGDSGLL